MREERKEPKEQASTSSSSSHKGGSVLLEKNNEPIEAALRAYDSRLAAQLDLPEKLRLYPNAREEKARMFAGRPLIRETQTMMEGPLPVVSKGPIKLTPSLETILEVSSQKENAQTESGGATEKGMYASKGADTLEEIPEADENLASNLWREVQKRADEEKNKKNLTPPFSLVSGYQFIADNCPADSLNRRTMSNPLSESGEYGNGAPTKRVPTLIKVKEEEVDTNNM